MTNHCLIDIKDIIKDKQETLQVNGLSFKQKKDIDYDETFALVIKWSIIRTFTKLTTIKGWKLHQIDVKTAFFNRVLKEEVFMKQPHGFITEGN